jgi:hypothetical protein
MFQHLHPLSFGQRLIGKCGKQVRVGMASSLLVRRPQALPN